MAMPSPLPAGASVPAGGITISAVTKRYAGVTALDDVSLRMPGGMAIGLVGENGAGKSTLTKILAGAVPASAYEGTVSLDGEPLAFDTPADASAQGIALIPQELSLHPDLSIAENVMLGLWPAKASGLGRLRIDWTALRDEATRVVRRIGLTRSVTAAVSSLSPSEQQLVAIARALAREPRVLLLDEPTASLDSAEVERLLAVLRRLRSEGVTLLYISHRLAEIFAVCDRVVVLRDGKVVTDDAVDRLDRAAVVHAMLGTATTPDDREIPDRPAAGDLVLHARIDLPDPRRRGGYLLRDLELDLCAGEVVGLVGLVGSGRTETLWSIFGALPRQGEVRVNGVSVPADPAAAVRLGIGLVTEERRSTGLFPLGTVADNVVSASYRELARRGGWMSRTREDSATQRVIRAFGIKVSSPRVGVSALSGGNQQKSLLGRWMVRDTAVLLLDEPARGIDVGAKTEIYAQLRRLADEQGLAILTTSSDLGELVGVCDRFVVLRDGRVVARLDAAEATEARLHEIAGTVPGDPAADLTTDPEGPR